MGRGAPDRCRLFAADTNAENLEADINDAQAPAAGPFSRGLHRRDERRCLGAIRAWRRDRAAALVRARAAECAEVPVVAVPESPAGPVCQRRRSGCRDHRISRQPAAAGTTSSFTAACVRSRLRRDRPAPRATCRRVPAARRSRPHRWRGAPADSRGEATVVAAGRASRRRQRRRPVASATAAHLGTRPVPGRRRSASLRAMRPRLQRDCEACRRKVDDAALGRVGSLAGPRGCAPPWLDKMK